MRRFLAFMVGAASVAVVIRLGFLSIEDPGYILWFGLAAALVAPVGLALLSYALFGGSRVSAKRLSKVPEIAELIDRAETEEEKLRLLEVEKLRLEEFVRYEAERMTLESRKAALEDSASRVLNELNDIEGELKRIDAAPSSKIVSEQVQQLRHRLQVGRRGDLVFQLRGRSLIIPSSSVRSIPYWGELFYEGLKTLSDLQVRILTQRIKNRQRQLSSDAAATVQPQEEESTNPPTKAPTQALADGPAPPQADSAGR